MSAGPWVVVDCDGMTDITNEDTSDVLTLVCMDGDNAREWRLAHRIAERLNKTEGDER